MNKLLVEEKVMTEMGGNSGYIKEIKPGAGKTEIK